MCGRFSLTTELQKLEERFFIENMESLDFNISYNIAPGQPILAIVKGTDKNKAGYLHWGLIPSFAKDKKIGYKMINARAETLHDKVSFKRLVERRRCLIPADSFYEWKQIEGRKTPIRFILKNEQPFAFAGLWDRWECGEEEIVSCTIITTQPNSLVKNVHNRMPAILKREHEKIWIDPNEHNGTLLSSLLQPYNEALMDAYQVSSAVNSPKNNNQACIIPI